MEKNRWIYISVLAVVVYVLYSCTTTYGKNKYYKTIPINELDKVKVSASEREIIKKHISNWVNVEKYLPKNAVKNASVDYTHFIQKALDENRNIEFPNYPLLINDKGLTISSNSVVFFNEKSLIKLKPNPNTHYELLRIHDVKNVKLYFANVQGDYPQHTGTTGEWGMGISIRGTENIQLIAPIVKQCWGDGIYLGISPITNSVINKNITITKAFMDENRRNGMSIISAQNLNVNQMLVANTFGTPPMAGIDIEPDSNNDIIQNFNFNKIHSFNNTTHAFLFVFGNLYGKPQNIGKININNLSINHGGWGISFKIGQEKEFMQQPFGEINLSNLSFNNLSQTSFLSYDGNHYNQVKVTIKLKTNSEVQENIDLFKNSKNIKISQ